MSTPGAKLSFTAPDRPEAYTSPATTGNNGNGNPGKDGDHGVNGPKGKFSSDRQYKNTKPPFINGCTLCVFRDGPKNSSARIDDSKDAMR